MKLKMFFSTLRSMQEFIMANRDNIVVISQSVCPQFILSIALKDIDIEDLSLSWFY